MSRFAERTSFFRIAVSLVCCSLATFAAPSGTGRYSSGVGRIGGCTATLVSPPGAEITTLVLASHCIRAPNNNVFVIQGKAIRNFTCTANLDYLNHPDQEILERGMVSENTSALDVALCFSKQKITENRVIGCVRQHQWRVGDEIRALGFGNPDGGEQVEELLQSTTRVNTADVGDGKAILAGPALVPGDSGGPVTLKTEAESADAPLDHFDFIGVNSGGNPTRQTPFGQLIPGTSMFAPFSSFNRPFFDRALKKFGSLLGAVPKICGINWEPPKPTTPPPATPPTTPPTAPPTVPPPGPTQPDHDGGGGWTPRKPRATDNRPAAEIIGERVKADFPTNLAQVGPFLRWLNELAQEDLKQSLIEIFRDPNNQEFQDFARGAGGLPSKSVLNRVRHALMKDASIATGEIADPKSPLNAAWLKVLNDPQVALRRPEQALALLNTLRNLARQGESKSADLQGLAARWASSSMTEGQRRRAAELLEGLTLTSEGVPPEIRAADARVKRFLMQALTDRTGSPDSATARAQKEARTWSEQWNRTLDEAIPDPAKIDLDREITVHEKGDEKISVRAWIQRYLHAVGYDELVRWATSVGGQSGRKTLALLTGLGAEPGQPSLGIEIDRGKTADLQTAPGQHVPAESDALLRLKPDSAASGLDAQMRSMMPPASDNWGKIRFVPGDHLPTGPHPEIAFERLSSPAPMNVPSLPPVSNAGEEPPGFRQAQATLNGKCQKCHESDFPALADRDKLLQKLESKSPAALDRTLKRMLATADGTPQQLTEAEIENLKKYLADRKAPTPTPTASVTPAPPAPIGGRENVAPLVMPAEEAIQWPIFRKDATTAPTKSPTKGEGGSWENPPPRATPSRPYPTLRATPSHDGWEDPSFGPPIPVPTLGTSAPPSAPTPGAPRPTLSAEDQRAIERYENLTYPDNNGRPGPDKRVRFDYPKGVFSDIPEGGTDRVIIAYFGDHDRPDLHEMVRGNPYLEVKRYGLGTPEHEAARIFGAQALALDGLGRKITRYPQDPSVAIRDMNEKEVPLLKAYLAAKAKQREAAKPAAPPSATQAPLPPSATQAPLPPAGSVGRPEISAPVAHAMGACVKCHQAQGLAGVSSPEKLASKIGDMSEARFSEMLRRALAADPSIDHSAMKSFFETARRFHQSQSDFSSAKPLRACYGDEAKQNRLRQGLPSVSPSSSAIAYRLAAARNAGQLLFYDDKDVPDTFQVPDFNHRRWSMGIPERDFGTRQFGYYNHPNREWPWRFTAGTDLSKNARSQHFIIPPPGGSFGQYVPVAVNEDIVGKNIVGIKLIINGFSVNPSPGDSFTVKFDAGTTFGEQIRVHDPDTGEDLTTEIRLRIKKPDGGWKMDVLRPFENPAELAAAVRKLVEGKPAWSDDPKVKAFLAAMDNPIAPIVDQDTILNRISDIAPRKMSKPAIDAIQAKAALHDLPELPHEIVRILLKTTPFKSVFGKPWISADGATGWAPTTQSDFQIVPKNYFGAFIPTTDQACMKCHENAGLHVDNLDHPKINLRSLEGNRNRSWYDNVRGMYGEGILSWNPGDAEYFRQRQGDGQNLDQAGPWVFNQCLSNGMIRGLPRQ